MNPTLAKCETDSSQSSMPPKLASVLDILDKYDNFLFDCDGVLWDASTDLPYAFDLLNFLHKIGKKLFFITNTSTSSREAYKSKFTRYGYDVKLEQLYPSSYLAGKYIHDVLPDVKKVYVFGMKGLIDELNNHGIATVGGPDDNDKKMTGAAFKDLEVDPEIDALVCGYDTDLNYYKYCYSALLLQKGKKFIATNEDAFDSVGDRKIPTSMIQTNGLRCTMGVEPIVLAKPNPYALELLCTEHGLDKSKCVMLGDRLNTDIVFANAGGIDSILILTGVTTLVELNQIVATDGASKPTYYVDNLKFQSPTAQNSVNGI